MATAPQWKLRRLAPRAIRVHDRRSESNAALKSFGTTMVPLATAFIGSYDSVKRFNTKWQKEMREGRGAVSALITSIRSWLPRLGVDIPQFDRSTFADTNVPDDVMEDAQRLLETVEDHQELAQDPENKLKSLAYAEELQAELEPALELALKEWREAEEADSEYQQALARTRQLANDFEHELVAYRATLSTTFGRSDADYQKLRTAKASASDPDDDETAPQVAEPQVAEPQVAEPQVAEPQVPDTAAE